MKDNQGYVAKWYSNTSLKWIWMRSILVATAGSLGVVSIWGTDKVSLLMTVVCIPLILGILNTISRNIDNSSEGHETTHKK
jgi:hypothetical protein